LVDGGTNTGHTPLNTNDAETIMDWAQEYKYPGFRAGPNDVAGNHGQIGPHIHIPGAGRHGKYRSL
jgi:hypothetical protein